MENWLTKLFEVELKDIYSAKNQVLNVFPDKSKDISIKIPKYILDKNLDKTKKTTH